MRTELISERIKSLWPDIIDWNPTDVEYAPVDTGTIDRFIDTFPALPWKASVNECEEIARRWVSQIRETEISDGSVYNRAIGVAFCTKHRGVEERHTVNICIGETEIYLVDMQTGVRWLADPDQDNIYFVEM